MEVEKAWHTAFRSPMDTASREAMVVLAKSGMTTTLGCKALTSTHEAHVVPACACLREVAGADASEADIVNAITKAHAHIEQARALCRQTEVALASTDLAVAAQFELRFRASLRETVMDHLGGAVHKIMLRDFHNCASADASSADMSKTLKVVCSRLVSMGLLPLVQDGLGRILFEQIDDRVRRSACGRVEEGLLQALREWVYASVTPWLESILAAVEQGRSETPTTFGSDSSVHVNAVGSAGYISLQHWRKRLAFHLHETLAVVRIDQVLKLVAHYPRSVAALQDLKECLKHTDKKSTLIVTLREQFTSQLLHAGTVTADILQQYINLIRALRFLDPSGVILESVSGPIKECLRSRPDTVRSIVSGMTGDGDLYAELERGRQRASRSGSVDPNSSDATFANLTTEDDDACSDAGDDSEAESLDEEDYATWQPEPMDAPPRHGRWRPGGDAIVTLVAIYGSSEQIVSEYRAMLADKLVSSLDVDLDRESRILDLLRQRFGVDAMHDCTIMLKDIRDSRTSLTTARKEDPAVARALSNFEATIISKEFWPTFPAEPAHKPPAQLVEQARMLASSFERVKEPRKLRWQDGLGATQLRITFDDGRVVSLNATPLQAAILVKFSEKRTWAVPDLAKALDMDDEVALRRRLVLLANQEVIRATDGAASTYETIERAEELDSNAGVADEDMGAMDDANAEDDADDDPHAQMAVYETFIMAMLQNLKALPLDRIHGMLQMVVRTPPYDKTQSQLAGFLAKLVDDEKIELHAGLYKVKS